MSLILKILLWILLIIICLLVCLVIFPYKYQINGNFNTELKGEFKIKWLFGIVKFKTLFSLENPEERLIKLYLFNIRILNKNINDISHKPKTTKKDKNQRKKKKKKANIKDIINIIKISINVIKPKKVIVYGKYGFDDPFYTGISEIILSIMRSLVKHIEVDLQPIFNEEYLDIKCDINGSVSVFLIGFRIVKYFVSYKINKIKNKSKKVKISETY